jgi:hypothetical protein
MYWDFSTSEETDMVYGRDRDGRAFRLNFSKSKDLACIDSFIQQIIDLLVERPDLNIQGDDLLLLGASLRALTALNEANKIPKREEMH